MYSNYRKNDIEKKLRIGNFRPLDIMITGITGAGKSTTLNSFFKKEKAKVGYGVNPETENVNYYNLNDFIRIWDTPGLGDDIEKDEIYSKNIKNLLHKTYNLNNSTYRLIDLVLIIIDSSSKDMGTTYKLINELILPNFQENRVLIAINQADIGMKGRFWDYQVNKPELKLKNFLDEKVISIQNRIKDSTNLDIVKPIYYSALNNYNVNSLFDLIINNIPYEKRKRVR